MTKLPPLEVITKDVPENTTSLDRIIETQKLLKIKIKLIHISLFDHDLKSLNKANYDLKSLYLYDFRLTKESNLVVPIYSRIIPSPESKNILESYLIYLSYLYNLNLVEIYSKNYHLFHNIIINLDLPVEIKINLFELIKYHKGKYFSDHLKRLNTDEYREKIYQDSKRIRQLKV